MHNKKDYVVIFQRKPNQLPIVKNLKKENEALQKQFQELQVTGNFQNTSCKLIV